MGNYLIPEEYDGLAAPGCRVMVPFGRGNRKRQGVIFALSESADFAGVKPVSVLLDETPVLSDEMLLMAKWLRDNYYCKRRQIFRHLHREEGGAGRGRGLERPFRGAR